MVGSTVIRSDDQREVGSKVYYYVCDFWMSIKTYKDHWTEQDKVGMISLLIDLGRRLDSFERETFCPHVWCRQHDAIIDFPKKQLPARSDVAYHEVDM